MFEMVDDERDGARGQKLKKINQNQLTVICTTHGERRFIGFRCHKTCMKSKLIISCRMMHNLIKRVMSYFTD